MIARILRALSTLAELAALPRRIDEIDRRLAVETRLRTEDTVWLRRELGLHLAPEPLPAVCYTCGATHGRVIARVIRPVWDATTQTSVRRWCRVLRCVACGVCQDAPEGDAIVESVESPASPEEQPS